MAHSTDLPFLCGSVNYSYSLVTVPKLSFASANCALTISFASDMIRAETVSSLLPSAVDVDDDLVVIHSRTSFLKTEYNKGWA